MLTVYIFKSYISRCGRSSWLGASQPPNPTKAMPSYFRFQFPVYQWNARDWLQSTVSGKQRICKGLWFSVPLQPCNSLKVPNTVPPNFRFLDWVIQD